MTKKSNPPKSASFTKDGIDSLPQGRPVAYEIRNKDGGSEYIGSAKRGRVGDRLKEHLPGGQDPVSGGAKVVVRPQKDIATAQSVEAQLIKDKQPSQNKKGK